jgi:hypothetical protein
LRKVLLFYWDEFDLTAEKGIKTKTCRYAIKIWHLSFRAGIITYLMALALIVFATFLETVKERKDNQIFSSQFQNKFLQLKADNL